MKSFKTISALLIGALIAVPGFATVIQIDFSASLTVNYNGGLGTMSVGDVITGNIKLDDSIAGTPYSDPNYGYYWSNFASSETVNGQTVLNPLGFAQIVNDSSPSVYNGDLVSLTLNYPASGGFTLGGVSGVSTGFSFYGYGNYALISNANLAAAAGIQLAPGIDARLIFYNGNQGGGQGSYLGEAKINYWQNASVPDQGMTLAMLGLGFVGLAVLRRKLARG